MPPSLGKTTSLLSEHHKTDAFDCGTAPLTTYLRRFALHNIRNNSSRTYVATRGKTVIGYYTLVFGSVSPSEVPDRVRKGLARHPIPVMLLARIAVDFREQGHGIGKGLIKDAMLRTLQAAKIAGLRAMVVHAKDEEARGFYQKFGFEAAPRNTLHLFLLMKDLKHNLFQ